MKLGTFISTAALAASLTTGLAAGAQAQQLLASDPQTFVDFFVAEGYRPELREDTVGDPMVMFRHEGKAEYLLFYDCTDHVDCLAVQFYAGYQLDAPVSAEAVNTWNGSLSRRFTRAFVSEDGSVSLEMDIATSRDGISERDFRDLVGLWLLRKGEFEAQIGF